MSMGQKRTGEQAERSTEERNIPLRYRKALGVITALAIFTGAGCGGDKDTSKEPDTIRDSYTVESGDVTLHVETQGDLSAEEVVIAIHGGPGLSLESLEDLKPLADEDRLLVRYDQRGSGLSTAPTDGDFSLQSQVEDIEAIRQSTGADKVDLIGRSWGGLLATAYAVSNPEKVDDLVLISAIPLDIPEFLAGQERFSNRVTELQESNIIPNPLPDVENNSCEARINAVLPAYMANPNGSTPDGVGSCTADASQLTYEAILGPGVLRPYVVQADRYTGDVLILAGEKDPFGVQWPQKIHEVLARGATEQVIFTDTGHFVTFEKPEKSLQLMDEFLD